MAPPHGCLILTVYAPPLVADDGRPVAVVHAMERALPGLRLEWTISDEGQPLPVAQRDTWVAQERMDGGFPLLYNGDANYRVTLTGWERPAGVSPGGHAQLQIQAKLPMDARRIAADVLEGLAESARAFWGCATPESTALEIAYQTAPTLEGPPSPPRGLPALKLFEDIRSPEIPYFLGWLNYWSAAAARTIGFPDLERDAELLSRARRTASGGWIVRLTEEPLDLDDPSHLDALVRAYERFPTIGGRSPS